MLSPFYYFLNMIFIICPHPLKFVIHSAATAKRDMKPINNLLLFFEIIVQIEATEDKHLDFLNQIT